MVGIFVYIVKVVVFFIGMDVFLCVGSMFECSYGFSFVYCF